MTFTFTPSGKEGQPLELETAKTTFGPLEITVFNALGTCIVKAPNISGTRNADTPLPTFGTDLVFQKTETPVTIYESKKPIGIINWEDKNNS